MRAWLTLVGVVALSVQANAQSPDVWGNLREFVRLQQIPNWASHVAEASRGNVVTISIPRSASPQTWEEAVTFHYFEAKANGSMMELANSLLYANARACRNIRAIEPRSVGSGEYDMATFRLECQYPKSDPANRRPRDVNYSHTLLIKGKHHTFMIMRQYEANDLSLLTPAKRQQLDQAALAIFRSARICDLEAGVGLGNRKCVPGTEKAIGAAIR